jgi:hypothetical protein
MPTQFGKNGGEEELPICSDQSASSSNGRTCPLLANGADTLPVLDLFFHIPEICLNVRIQHPKRKLGVDWRDAVPPTVYFFLSCSDWLFDALSVLYWDGRRR